MNQRIATIAGEGRRRRVRERVPAPRRRGVVRNVHLDAREPSNVTFPMTVMGFVHLDAPKTSRCTLRGPSLPRALAVRAAVDVRAMTNQDTRRARRARGRYSG